MNTATQVCVYLAAPTKEYLDEIAKNPDSVYFGDSRSYIINQMIAAQAVVNDGDFLQVNVPDKRGRKRSTNGD